MTTQEIVQRIPPEIAKAGVTVQTDDDGGYRALSFPPAIHDHFNVLLPNAEVVQADPNWSPAIRSVSLDVDRHTYHDGNSRTGERSLNKLGLLALASVAGLEIEQTTRVPVAQLRDNEIGWQATISVRRSDGTRQAFTASKIVNLDVEREKVIAGVNKIANKTQDERRAIYEKRWLYEREHCDSKAETKAIERAIREALQVPHSFAEGRLAKPFLVVAYSLTPDWSDPEVRRILLERAVNARNQLYPPAASPAAGELEASPAQVPAGDGQGEDAGAGTVDAAAASGDQTGGSREAPASEPADFDGEEPDFTAPDGAPAEAVEAAAAAAEHVVQFGKKHKGRTLDQIAKEHRDPKYVVWLADEMEPKTDLARAAKAAAGVYADAFLRSGS